MDLGKGNMRNPILKKNQVPKFHGFSDGQEFSKHGRILDLHPKGWDNVFLAGGGLQRGPKSPDLCRKRCFDLQHKTSHATVSFRFFFPDFYVLMPGWTKHPRVVDPTFF